jgi:hypothetical protein
MTERTTKTDRAQVGRAERPFVAGYWPVRIETPEVSAGRVLGLLDELPDGPEWRLADVDGSEEPLALQPAALAEQLIRDTRAQEVGAGILSSVLREGVVVVRLSLGTGSASYGQPDSVIITSSQPFDPVELITSLVRHLEPVWAVAGLHRLRRAQRPPRASAPWLGTTTYLPGALPAPAGSTVIPLKDGTVIDFTDRGRIDPDDETILAASRRVLLHD